MDVKLKKQYKNHPKGTVLSNVSSGIRKQLAGEGYIEKDKPKKKTSKKKEPEKKAVEKSERNKMFSSLTNKAGATEKSPLPKPKEK